MGSQPDPQAAGKPEPTQEMHDRMNDVLGLDMRGTVAMPVGMMHHDGGPITVADFLTAHATELAAYPGGEIAFVIPFMATLDTVKDILGYGIKSVASVMVAFALHNASAAKHAGALAGVVVAGWAARSEASDRDRLTTLRVRDLFGERLMAAFPAGLEGFLQGLLNDLQHVHICVHSAHRSCFLGRRTCDAAGMGT